MRSLLVLAACLVPVANAAAAEKKDLAISGEIRLGGGLDVRPGSRLVIRMFHPDDGIEKDLKYWILDDFALPQVFSVAPTVNMAGNARWDSYVIEVFTDTDRDVLNLTADEVWATTGVLVPVGTAGIELILERRPPD